MATQRLNTLFDNTKRPLSVSTSNTNTGELAKIRPHWIDRFAGNSNTIVRKVSPNLQDTIYAVDDGVRKYANYPDGSYAETVPIIGPGRYTGSTPPTREALQNQFERYYKKEGGTINKFQRGNVLTNREQHLVDVSRLPKLSIPQVWSRKLFGTGPKPVETGRTFLNKAGEQVPEVGNRIIMPGGRDNTTITRGTNYGSG